MNRFYSILFSFLFIYSNYNSLAQSGLCDPQTPFYTADLTNIPNGTWVSDPPVQRNGNCCGTSSPDRCIEFEITLAPNVVAINFSIASGAIPPGAMFYQIGCGPQVAVGSPICVNGPGPHTLTFCKPGNNQNTYAITSIGGPSVGPADTTTVGCSSRLYAQQLIESTITWTSIYPGVQGAYNSYLSCTSGCDTTYANPQPGAPPFVDFMVCGQPNTGACSPPGDFCDTVRIYFYPEINNMISPNPASFCANTSGILLDGIVNGGVPPYQYQWTNGANGTGSTVGNAEDYFSTAGGTYSLTVRDGKFPTCPETVTNVTVTVDLVPIVNAGSDQTVCPGNTSVTLNGSVYNAEEGIWSGGIGTFIPNTTDMNPVYIPHSTEVANGSVTLTLTSIVSSTCPAVSDNMTIYITPPLQASITAPAFVCYGVTSTLTANVSGGSSPYTYLWNTGATTQSITNQPAGNYSVTVTDATLNSCSVTTNFSIAENPELRVDLIPDALVSCNTTVTIIASPAGGSGVYTYLWSNGATTSSIVVTTGSHTVTITDSQGCTASNTISISTVNAPISVSVNQPPTLCNGTDVDLTATPVGGYGNYTYLWNTGATTNSITVGSGSFCATVTDINGCNATACVVVSEDAFLTVTVPSPPVICNGTTTTVTATPGGGQTPYTYLWNTGQTTATITQGAGVYSVTVTDDNLNSCTAIDVVTITEEPLLSVIASAINVDCNGGSTGSVSAAVTGGIGPFNYLWSPGGQSSSTVTGLAAGIYSVTVTDNIGCTTSSSVTITQPAATLSVSVSSTTNVNCNGANNGTITVTATGGTPNYTYLWSPGGQTTATINNLAPGNYSVTVTDANGCTANTSRTITQPTILTSTISSSSNITCNGTNNGTITVTATGGTSGYTYLWLPGGQTTATINNLSPGNYSVTITDANGCTATATQTITEPTQLTAAISSSTNITCNGANNGTAIVTVTGGTTNYTYLWSPGGQTTAAINNLAPGIYTVTITDANGCTATATQTITQPNVLTVTISSGSNITCNGAGNGSATVLAAGGTSPYTYQWLPGGQTTSTANNLSAGTYTVTITDANNCTATATQIITQPAILSSSVSSNANISCNGIADGTATVTASGGTTPYSYSWSPTGGNAATASGLAAGTYTVTVTDANNCVSTSTVTLSQPVVLAAAISSSTNITCNGANNGTATVAASGGTPNYTYLWSPGGQTTTTVNNLAPGIYTATITDANGCTASATQTITQPAVLSATISSSANISCNGANDGTATMVAAGGTAPYSYLWLPSGQTTATANNLAPATYTVTITDANNCTATATQIITQPATFTTSISSSANISCNGVSDGTATVAVSGGTTPYNYAWSSSGGNTATASGLAAGTYTVTVTDANNCVSTSTVTLSQPVVLAATISSSTNISCNGANNGTATVAASGGTANYTYSWSPGGQTTTTVNNLAPGIYTATITDANGCTVSVSQTITQPAVLTATISSSSNITCNGINNGSITVSASGGTGAYTYQWSPGGMNTPTVNNLAPGNYSVTVTDANNCTATATQNITQPTQLTATISASTNITCNGANNGTVTVAGSGGTPNYTYLWNPGGQTTATATNLAPGTYTVTVTDANGCTATASRTITQPTVLNATISASSNINCYGSSNGTITVAASGGTSGYTYLWLPGGQTTATINNLAAGNYSVTVTDANNCTATATQTITQPTQLTTTISASSNISCNGANDGTASLVASGGTAPYTYLWMPSGQTTSTANNLAPGTYTVTITDANGCTATATQTITQPAVLTASISSSSNITCNGVGNGSATVLAAGGTSPYVYQWLPGGQTTSTANNLTPGTYTVTITDANSCTATATQVITQPSILNSSISGSANISCNGVADGTATVSASGGTTPYIYSWSPTGGNAATASGLAAGTYTVTVTDANNCVSTSTVTLTQPVVLVAAISASTNITCNGANNGTATVAASGGTPNYTYLWSPGGQTTSTVNNLAPGIYTATITDANGCTASAAQTITQPAVLSATISSSANISCNGANDGTATVIAAGGTAPYSYLWLPSGQTTATANNLAPATYTVTITDANNCTATATQIITQPATFTTSISSSSNISCNGFADGTATVAVSGGTTPYNYAWSPSGGNAATADGLSAGTYTVTVTDANNCVSTSSVTLTQPVVLAASISASTNVTCNAANNGTATVAASGGTPNYSYLWSPGGQTTTTVNNLAPGIYTATITDANGCTVSVSQSISEPVTLTASIATSSNVSCFGGNNGTASVLASGGTSPYVYQWLPGGQTTGSVSNLVAGNYSVTITDANNCTATATISITEPTALTVGIVSFTDVNCNGDTDGSVTISASGGTPAYTYSWSPGGQTTTTISNLGIGPYTATVTDANGCNVSISHSVSQPNALVASISSSVNVSCFGTSTGSASVLASGGATPYSYAWLPGGQTTSSVSNLAAGNYSVTVTDANNCTITTTVTITQPAVLSAGISSSNNITCNGANNGTITVTAAGGTSPYSYQWLPGGMNTATVNNLAPGPYTATITDANGCTTTATQTITQPAVLTATISASSNITCNGAGNGSATVLAAGGTSPYVYQWLPGGQTTSTANNLSAGTYTVTITDANNCTATATQVITQPAILSSSISGSANISCNGVADGTATVSASGGTTPYIYSWSPTGGNAATASGLSAGTYTVTVTDANNCVSTSTVTLTQPVVLAAAISASTNITCNGANNGTATVAASGGTPNYSYLWSPGGQTTSSVNNLAPGIYTATITDANGCTASATQTITQPAVLSATISSSANISCNGANDGTATVVAAGGTAPYSYLWLPSGQTTATATNLSPATYTVTITDANNCTATATQIITQPATFTSSISSSSNISCNGFADGTATVAVSGGTTPYNYAWSPSGGNAATASGLAAGTYTVTVTDANNCVSTSTVTLTQPVVLAASISASTNITCNDANNGTATVAASGGTPNYSYLWSPGGQTTSSVNNLAPGNYSVTITDANGCTTTATQTITQPALLTATISSSINISCNSANDGTATVIAGGGTTPYSYLWLPSGQTTATATNLAPGNYTVTITDANGCTATATQTITQPVTLTTSISSFTNISCNGNADGTATVTVSGGTTPYGYSWSPTGGNAATATGLAAGTYTVTVTDNNNCTTSSTITLTQPTQLSATISSSTNVSCNGANNGTATVTATGGTTPYSYLWLPGAQITAAINNLTPGTYTVTITDANGCTSNATQTITQPVILTAAISASTNITCNGANNGTATVAASGGTPNYTYLWSPGGQTTAAVNNLAPGIYIATITDANNCTTTATQTITQPTQLTATISSSANITCNSANDGTATVLAAGGTTPYSYLWLPGGQTTATVTNLSPATYTVTITDANNCTATATQTITQPVTLTTSISSFTNISCNGVADGIATVAVSGGTTPYGYSWSPTGGNAATATGLTAGTYTVTVTDNNNCTATSTVTLTQPIQLTATISASTNITCNGANNGTATVIATGGTANYAYLWSPGGQTTSTVNNLSPGIYTVTITDANNCTTTATQTITQPTVLTATISSSTNITCNSANNGTATVIAAGGTSPYTYLWLPGGQTTATATNLTPGNYSVTITDANNCSATATQTITQPVTLTATISGNINVTCNGANNGTITATAAGGTPNYTYLWSPGGQTTATAINLAPGNYTVTITDANNCTATATQTISQPTILTATISSSTNVTCNGANNGTATVTASGGTPNYTYLWSPGAQTTAAVNNLAPGNYSVTITDANGCTTTATQTITQPTQLTATISSNTNITCNGSNNGTATVTAAGGTPNYTYTWSPGAQTTATATNLAPGIYTVTITDNNNCTATATQTITQPVTLSTSISSFTNITCNGNADGTASVTVSGGTTPYIYSWSPTGGNAATATGLAVGTYTVTVTDNNNCTTSSTITLTQPTQLTATISASANITCNGANDGTATVMATGGTTSYSYLWLPSGQTTATATNLAPGNYTVTVNDANNCTATATQSITQPTQLTATISASANITCNGANDGTASVTASGGTINYTYLWSPSGQTTATASNLAPGTHTVTVTDNNNCTITATQTITQPNILTATISSSTNITCNGANNGTATVIAAGGTSPYTYLWLSGGQTTATANNLAPGTYTITITDNNNCTATATQTITEPATLTATISSNVNVTCNGANDGTATVIATGGTTPYAYFWTPGAQTTATASNLAPGTYTVTVTDNNNCTTTATQTITQPTQLTASISTITNITCNGANNGTATVAATGGTPNYTYLWSPGGQTTAAINNLAPGNYTATITDANGCTTTVTQTITQPTTLTATISATANITCNSENDGTATVIAAGGTTPYSYLWLPSGQTTATATNLAPGNYTVTITDANNCTATATQTITQPVTLTTSISSFANITCNGVADGTATVAVSGGTTPYNYAWSPTGGNAATATGLTAGTYTVTVTDNNNCISTSTVTITQPIQLAATIFTSTNITCNGANNGTATVNASGGTPNYSYLWTPGSQTTTAVNNLAPGNYSVTITDVNGCTTTATQTITEPTQVTATISSSTNITCNGANDGTITVIAAGGTSPYIYQWLPGGQTTAVVNNLSPGTYTVTVTDDNGCTTNATQLITQPVQLTATISSSLNITCNGANNGTATVIAAGGTSPYSYLWLPGGQTASTANNLSAGIFTVTITDNNNCTTTATTTITEPATLSSSVSSFTNISCNGLADGSATVAVSGGTTPYIYSWSPLGGTTATATGLTAGTYTVTVSDDNNCTTSSSVTLTQPIQLTATISSSTNVACNGANNGTATVTAAGGTPNYTYLWSPSGQTTATAVNLAPGSYSVTVTDDNNCTATTTQAIIEPTQITATISASTNISCNGETDGTATVIAAGGTNPYTYLWLPGGQTTATATNLAAGNYTVTITDDNNCTATATQTITEPAILTATISSSSNITCNGIDDGTATVTAAGGTNPYTYFWSPGGQTAATANNLSPGTHTVIVTDNNNCTATTSVIISEPLALIFNNVNVVDANCFGENTGSITVQISGGSGNYTYQWTPASGNSPAATNLYAGDYDLSVVDGNNCVLTNTFSVSEPHALNTTISSEPESCGDAHGSVSVYVFGGTPTYNYLWSNGETSTQIDSVASGLYFVTVTDEHGCTLTDSSQVDFMATVINVVPVVTHVSCNGSNDGSIALNVSGPPPYFYIWSDGSTQASLNGLSGGTYSVSVSNSYGCTDTSIITIYEPLTLAYTTSITPITCNGLSDGSITITPSGGTGNYNYQWTPNLSTTATAAQLAAGNYSVYVSDINGCNVTFSTALNNPSILTSSISGIDVGCNGDASGMAFVTVAGGAQPYSYSWSGSPSPDSIAIGLTAGLHTVTITDANGCSITNSITLSQPLPIISVANVLGDTICIGQSAIISLNATGGSGNFTVYWNQGLPSGNSHQVSPVITTTYTASAIDQSGCTGTPQQITVYVRPALSVVITAPDTICFGESATIFAGGSGGNGNYSYTWNQNLGNGTGPFTVSPIANTTYVVTLQDDCGTPMAQDSVTIYIMPRPDVVIRVDTTRGCAPVKISFYATVSPLIPGMVFTWNFGDGTQSNFLNPTHNYEIPGTYIVSFSVYTPGGCTLTTVLPTAIEVYPGVTAAFTTDPVVTSIMTPDFEIQNNSVNSTLWYWDFGDGNTSEEFSPTHHYEISGDFTILLISANEFGCSDTAEQNVTLIPEFTFYIPSSFTPNGDGKNDEFNGKGECINAFEMYIFDRWGNQIFQSFDYGTSWDGRANGGKDIAQIDVYAYRFLVTDCFNTIHKYTGGFTLVK